MYGEMRNELADFIFAHISWMALVVKKNKAPDPGDICRSVLKLKCLTRMTVLT
jgi:hypothetical protein